MKASSNYLCLVVIIQVIITIIITSTTPGSSALLLSPRRVAKSGDPIIEESVYEDGGVWIRGPKLGKGGYGSVHLAHFPTLFFPPYPPPRYQNIPLIVAVKSNGSFSYHNLVYEKSIYRALGRSPFLVRFFGDDGTASASNGYFTYHLFLEYASGGTLRDFIKIYNGLGLLESQAKEITRSILGGIDHIHKAGYVHCDIKPDNVFLVREGGLGYVAKIGDFGVTKKDVVRRRRYGVRTVRGTPMYLAPECLKQSIQGKPSDIWALGCVVFSMLTGTLRWNVAPDIQNWAHHQISEEAVDFVRQCLSVDPTDRPTAAMLLTHPFLMGMGSDDHKLQDSAYSSQQGLDGYRFSKEEEDIYHEIFSDVANELAFFSL